MDKAERKVPFVKIQAVLAVAKSPFVNVQRANGDEKGVM
jgi:hypothetical protein